MATEAYITGEVLRWARVRDGVSLAEAAKTVQVTPERVTAWEDEEERPTLKKAEALAHKLNIPFAYLFLPDPPVETMPLPDLRTLPGGASPFDSPSPNLLWVINDAQAKQQWYRDYISEVGATALPYVGSFGEDADPDEVADSIGSTLGIDDDLRSKATSWDNFLTLLVRQSEAAGVLVLRTGIVENNTRRTLDVSEFRGFAIVDDLAPLVFINSSDAIVARIFTLAHELAHIWIAESGVSNPDYRLRASEQPNAIERHCNMVAAEVLVPREKFLELWGNAEDVRLNLRRLTREFRVSRFVLLRRAFDLELVEEGLYRALYDEFRAESRAGNNEGGDFYNNLLAKSSRRLSESLLSALAQGAVSYREAAQLLNIKVSQLEKLKAKLLSIQ
ncbi:MAG: ImmA/IrrE family metallo-endopeptidase [Chloroflexi bacterium]|nr:ImmA/IrrE family metallo-endopeptidase [Chloroflexota bacterium]